jgi:hypothetical protein
MAAYRSHTGVDAGQDAGRPAPDAAQARRILELLRSDDVDAAIEAGLPAFVPLAELDGTTNDTLASARDRLLAAWAARERYRARTLRLDRIAGERTKARSLPAPPPAAADAAAPGTGATASAPAPSTLPPAAAAALARARARTSGRQP